MKRYRATILALAAATVVFPIAAAAQSTASPVVTGYLSTSGCSYGLTTCFVQYGAGSGGGEDVTIVGPLGTGTAATGVRTTLSATDAAALQSIVTNTGAAIPAGSAQFGSLNPSSYAVTTSLATSKVLKGSAGRLYALDVVADSTLSAAAWYVMVHDSTTAPAAGAVTPAKCYGLPAGTTTWTASWPAGGLTMATGISVTVSTTGCFTQTDSAHAFISGDYL